MATSVTTTGSTFPKQVDRMYRNCGFAQRTLNCNPAFDRNDRAQSAYPSSCWTIDSDRHDEINGTARGSYWKQVKSYLENHLPGGNYDVIVAGGAAMVMQPELMQLFTVMGLTTRISFGEGLQHQLAAVLHDDPDLCQQTSLISRMTDAYAVFGALWAAHQQTSAA